MTITRRARSAGFTLIETLVALAILGIVLTTVYGIFGGALRGAQRDEDRLLLALVARNLMARSRLDLFPADGSLSGDIGGGLRWRIEGTPYIVPEGLLPEAPTTTGTDRDTAFGEGDDGGNFADAAAPDTDEPGQALGEAEPGETGVTDGPRDPTPPREQVRLQLVRITVEKGAERYELAGLVQDPRRGRDRLR